MTLADNIEALKKAIARNEDKLFDLSPGLGDSGVDWAYQEVTEKLERQRAHLTRMEGVHAAREWGKAVGPSLRERVASLFRESPLSRLLRPGGGEQ